jgi:hypothetical protein
MVEVVSRSFLRDLRVFRVRSVFYRLARSSDTRTPVISSFRIP